MTRQHFQQGKGDVLFAHTRNAFVQIQQLGHFQQFVRRHALEIIQAVGREVWRQLRHRTFMTLLALAILIIVLAGILSAILAAVFRIGVLLIAVAVIAVVTIIAATEAVTTRLETILVIARAAILVGLAAAFLALLIVRAAGIRIGILVV